MVYTPNKLYTGRVTTYSHDRHIGILEASDGTRFEFRCYQPEEPIAGTYAIFQWSCALRVADNQPYDYYAKNVKILV